MCLLSEQPDKKVRKFELSEPFLHFSLRGDFAAVLHWRATRKFFAETQENPRNERNTQFYRAAI
jgi:hypothetical protein